MKNKWLEVAPVADEKQEERFETWLSGEGILFADPEAEKQYRERVTLIRDAVQVLKIRPCHDVFHLFPKDNGQRSTDTNPVFDNVE